MVESRLKESLREQIPEGVSIPDGKLLLAFSGGSDSLFLLIVLSIIAPDRTLALYVDHSIRDRNELDAEVSLNIQNASKYGIPLRIERVPDNLIAAEAERKGVEAAAREARYAILRSAAMEYGADHILTAHHREDQVETVLMRMLSSSPFYAYQGIKREDGLLFRPILSVPKKEILAFLSAAGAVWSEDSTNSDTGYLRNRIRHSVLPLISEQERCLILKIADNVSSFRKRYPELSVRKMFFTEAGRKEFLASPAFIQEEFLYTAFREAGVDERVPRKAIAEITRKAEEGKGRSEYGEITFFFSCDYIRIYPPFPDFVAEYTGKDIRFSSLFLKHEAEDDLTLNIDSSKLVPPVIVRTAREGDRIELKGGEKKISELEKDLRIPYSIVMEDRSGIVAFFSRFLGGRDRLAKRFLSDDRKGIALAIGVDYSYIQRDESYGR